MALSANLLVVLVFSLLAFDVHPQLSNERFYERSCPSLRGMVRSTTSKTLDREPRMGASILRLFFHDCFVNGCDGSILLDDTPTFTGEKNAFANRNSLRGYEVIDEIKSSVEAKCKATVSCADILALAARDSVFLLGGPTWEVELGRLDSRTASQSDANRDVPPPFANLQDLISMFAAKGFSAREMTALSGAHTIGLAKCASFRTRIHNESNIDPAFALQLQNTCSNNGTDILAPFDKTSNTFDNQYYKDLIEKQGLLHSDQELFNGGSQDSLVTLYSQNSKAFEDDFLAAMIKMGKLLPSTENNGEIRLNCTVVN